VTIEDVQGNIELVLFPRTWAQYELTLEVGGIIIVDGKVDANSNPPKILVDTIRTEIDVTIPLEEKPVRTAPAKPEREPAPSPERLVQAVAEPKPAYQVASAELSEIASSEDWEEDDTPPPPDAFPPGWDDYISMSEKSHAEPPPAKGNGNSPPARQSVNEAASQPQTAAAVVTQKPAESVPIIAPPPVRNTAVNGLSTLVADDHPPQLVTILLRPTNDKQRDLRIIQRLHGTCISHPGKDRFTFHIFEEGKGHLIEFPNDTTHACAELLDKLKGIVGSENIRIEPITYQ